LLTFDVELGQNGKERAHSVRYPVSSRAHKPHAAETPASWTLPRALAIPAFSAVWFYVASRWPVGHMALAVYIALSLVSFFAYALVCRPGYR
jgi:hypothetical protein